MRIAFYGSSLLSSYWNGAATYYRGLLRALAGLGHHISFFEPDAFDRQSHRDIAPPPWAQVHVYPATEHGVREALARGGDADVLIKASGVGVFDSALLEGIFATGRPHALRLFWDVDAPATLAALAAGEEAMLHARLPRLDGVFTYGGGAPVARSYADIGARFCVPIYNALDPASHFPVPPQLHFAADLSLLANRLPDREARIEEFFLRPAARLPKYRFVLGGSGWADKPLPGNVHALGHLGTAEHNAFNCSARAVLNVARNSMARTGFSPATRVFEAAGAGACLITDAWDGIELFLAPGEEILVARDGRDVAELLLELTAERAAAIGLRARARVLAEHTYDRRAADVADYLAALMQRKQAA